LLGRSKILVDTDLKIILICQDKFIGTLKIIEICKKLQIFWYSSNWFEWST